MYWEKETVEERRNHKEGKDLTEVKEETSDMKVAGKMRAEKLKEKEKNGHKEETNEKAKPKFDSESGKKRKHVVVERDDKSEHSQSEDDLDDENTVSGEESDEEKTSLEEEDENQDESKKQIVPEDSSSKTSAKKKAGSKINEKSKAVGKGSSVKVQNCPGNPTKKSSGSKSKHVAEPESKQKSDKKSEKQVHLQRKHLQARKTQASLHPKLWRRIKARMTNGLRTFLLNMRFAPKIPQILAKKEKEVVKGLNTERYMGRWYEIASFPSIFQPRNGVDTRATYKLNSDDFQLITDEVTGKKKLKSMLGSDLEDLRGHTHRPQPCLQFDQRSHSWLSLQDAFRLRSLSHQHIHYKQRHVY